MIGQLFHSPMKALLFPLLLSALFTASSSRAQSSSSIVGFSKLPVTGGSGTGTAALSFHTLSTRPAPVYESTATTATGSLLTDSAPSWTQDQYSGTHSLEVISSSGSTTAPGVGTCYNITTMVVATGVITIEGTLDERLVAPLEFRIAKHTTLADVFGATNTSGLAGGSATTADQVMLWAGPGFTTYYYQTSGIGGTGWRKLGAPSVDAAGTIIPPHAGIVIRRGASSTTDVVLTGAVKAGQTTAVLSRSGYHFVGNPYFAAMTLTSSGLYTGDALTGLLGGSSASAADQVLLWSGNSYASYYYNTDVSAWRSTTDATTDAGPTSIAGGAGFVILRRSADTVRWTAPQHPASY